MGKILVFSMHLDTTPTLNKGRVALIDTDKGGLIGRWVATSGLGMHQKVGGWSKQGGGVIPATYQCNPTFDCYQVSTQALDLCHVKGVECLAFPISPFEVKTIDGVKRSDLLIHLDANVPGSLGCIVMHGDEYKNFSKVFGDQCKDVDWVPLYVIYTY
jgi:hypothetical protein